jgi:trehalose-6-phosphate synthase
MLSGYVRLEAPASRRRSSGKDITELHDYCAELVAQINAKYATVGYAPVVWLERPVRAA